MKRKNRKGKNSKSLLFRNIIRTLKVYWQISPRTFVLKTILIILDSLLPILTTYLFGQLINFVVKYLANEDIAKKEIYILFSCAIAVGLVKEINWKVIQFIDRWDTFKWQEKFTAIVTQKMSSLDLEIHEDPKFNTLLNKVRDGYDYRPSEFAANSLWVFNDLVKIIGSLVVLITFSPILLPIIFVSLIPAFWINLRASQLKWGIWEAKGEVNKKYWEIKGALTHEYRIKEIKIFNLESYLISSIKSLMSEFFSGQRNIMKKEVKFGILAKFIEYAVGAGIELWMLLKVLAKDKNFGVGDYTFYLGIINNFAYASRNMLSNISYLYERNLFMTDLYKLLDMENKILFKENAISISNKKVPLIEFKNVSFKYPATDKYVYKNFSIKINPGEDIAFVGENGAGKTTFVKLLARFYDVTEGQILINGTDIRDLDLKSWYKNLGILFQDFNKYGFSVRENIGVGNTDEINDFDRIIKSAKSSGADSFIQEFKYKYDQILEKWFNKGIEISGGQWQRIALARAFFRNANILILDEPTAAIDAKGEYEIFKKIAEAQKDKTTIIISHRFSTVKKADKIFVIEHGEIKESGTHQELMNIKKGRYKQMFELQAEGYK